MEVNKSFLISITNNNIVLSEASAANLSIVWTSLIFHFKDMSAKGKDMSSESIMIAEEGIKHVAF